MSESHHTAMVLARGSRNSLYLFSGLCAGIMGATLLEHFVNNLNSVDSGTLMNTTHDMLGYTVGLGIASPIVLMFFAALAWGFGDDDH